MDARCTATDPSLQPLREVASALNRDVEGLFDVDEQATMANQSVVESSGIDCSTEVPEKGGG